MASPPEPAESAGWGELLRSEYAGALILLCAGIWLHAGDELMVATVIPAMVGDIGGDAYISWTTALYEVGSITASALGAWFARQIGLKRSLVIAALVYLVGCLVSAFAPVMAGMLVGRLVQGLGGGAIVAVTLVAAWRMFPGRLLPRAVAAISLVWG
ncbi:MAG: MFS transporter, partial [Rhizobiaceae bacterium]